MGNLKRFLSAFVVAALLATSIVPAFAADAFKYEAEANKLHDMGLLDGVSDTTFDPALGMDLKREEGIMMLLRLIGKADDAAAMTEAEAEEVLANFTDKTDVSDWAKKAIAYAVKNGLVQGMDATTLAPTGKLNGKMYATLLLRNLGYAVNSNDYNFAAAILADKGGLTVAEAMNFNNKDLIRDDLVGMSFGTLKAKDVTGKEVIQKLIEDGTVAEASAVAVGLVAAPTPTPTPVPEAFTVKSVSVSNLVKAVVSFNYELDEDSAETAGNYDIDGVTVSKAELNDDQKSVTLTVDAFDNGEEYELIVSDVEDINGTEIAETSITFTAVDNELPQVTSVEFTGPQTLKIKFDEPLNEASSSSAEVTLDDGAYSGTIDSGYDGKTEITVDIGTELDQGTHTIKVKGFFDFADHSMIVKTMDTAYEAVESPITVTVDEATQSYVTLKFNREVKGIEAESFYQTYSSWKPLEVQDEDGNVLTANDYTDTVKLIFTDAERAVPTDDDDDDQPLTVGTVKIVVKAEGNNADIEDRWENNLVDDVTLSASVSADTTAPTVTKVEVESVTEIEVFFSESMYQASVEDEENYTITNPDGDVLEPTDYTAAYTESDDEYKATITFDAEQDTGKYSIKVEGVKDSSLSRNVIAEAVTKEFTITDSSAIDFTDIVVTAVDGSDILYVKYPEAMATSGAGSVLDKDNYRWAATVAGTFAKLDDDVKLSMFTSKIVKMQFPADTDLAASKLQIGRVADSEGNRPDTMSYDYTNAGAGIAEEAAPIITEVKKIAENKLLITFDQELKSVSNLGILVDANNDDTETRVASISYVNEDGKGKVTVILASTDKSTGTEGLADGTSVSTVAGYIKSVTGKTSLAATYAPGDAGVTFKDGFAPKFSKDADDDTMIYAYDADGNDRIDHIFVKYSEAISADTVSKYTYSVGGFDVDTIKTHGGATTWADMVADVTDITFTGDGADGSWVVITIEEDEDVTDDTDARPAVTQKTSVEDASGNKLDAQSAVKAISAQDSATK